MIRQFLFAAALVACCVTSPVDRAEAAAVASLASTVTVPYDSLELRSEAGVARVYGALQRAARGSCDSLPSLDRWTPAARRRCHGDTLEAAIRRVNDARLTAHHRACQRSPADQRCRRPQLA